MSTSKFKIVDHVIDASHIREYARATLDSQEDVLKLAIKQYIPLDNPNPQAGDVTIIGAPANGFPKELYEPLWDDILSLAEANNFRIRAIWIADAAHQGASGVLNANKIGNDPSWLDHPRDLMHMINHFRMPLPLFGIGHSFGGNNLANISLMHPRLFAGHILLDPVITGPPSNPGAGPAKSSTFRRDLWSSREEAIKGHMKSPYYLAWDSRVLERWNQFGLIDTPTALYPNEKAGAVTLTTTKHQEVFTFLRPLFPDPSQAPLDTPTEYDHPDVDPDVDTKHNFYTPVPYATLKRIQYVRAPILYVFGATSPMNPGAGIKEKMDITGTGVGGSGGSAKGKVKEITLPNVGHLVPMEAPMETAKGAASFIAETMVGWREEARKYDEWTKKGKMVRQTTSDEWKRRMGGDPRAGKNGKGALAPAKYKL